ncbi:MAG TPA: DUF4097 family beta strand repeat-containing protein [Gemmatimonadales bacterium]|nr:DUF4097 family beta strand repeat-containing protein [Gemmatimonadales bacterium]
MRLHGLLVRIAPALMPLTSIQAQTDRDFRWQGPLAAGKTIEIVGVNGGIVAEGTTGRQVEVAATKTARRSDPSTVTFDVVEHPGGVTICAIYPSRDRDEPNECRPGGQGRNNIRNNDVAVEWTVKVPQGVRFSGRTVNGKIQGTGLTTPTEARTVNGGITIETTAWADAGTVNGAITARLGQADWDGEASFHTVNGAVTVWLPASASVRVEASTVNGSLETDFPLTIQGKWGPRRLSGTIGQGGRTLSLKTVNGSLALRKQ